MTARLVLDLPAHEYHAGPQLSSSTAHTLTALSPAHTKVRRPDTRETELGTLVHALLLGEEHRLFQIDEDSYRTKNAKAKRQAALAGGFVPVLRHKLDEYKLIASILNSKLIARGVDLRRGHNEASIYWTEDGIECRARLDQLDAPLIRDLKSCVSAHPNAIARAAVAHGYDIQEHVYRTAVERLHPELAGRVRTEYVFCELVEPYCVTVVRFGGTMRELGQRRWERAKGIWRQCTAANKWPEYTTDTVTIEAPGWALASELDASFDGEPVPDSAPRAAPPQNEDIDDAHLF